MINILWNKSSLREKGLVLGHCPRGNCSRNKRLGGNTGSVLKKLNRNRKWGQAIWPQKPTSSLNSATCWDPMFKHVSLWGTCDIGTTIVSLMEKWEVLPLAYKTVVRHAHLEYVLGLLKNLHKTVCFIQRIKERERESYSRKATKTNKQIFPSAYLWLP